MSHIFISYVRENANEVNAFVTHLRKYGLNTWIDRERLPPGCYWKDEIRKAIQSGGFFIAFFSNAYLSRKKSYMNEELTLAIDEMRQYTFGATWFIPVRLSGEIPDFPVGAGRTLRDINWVDVEVMGLNCSVDCIVSMMNPELLAQYKALDEYVFGGRDEYGVRRFSRKSAPRGTQLHAMVENARSEAKLEIRSRLLNEWPVLTSKEREFLTRFADNRRAFYLSDAWGCRSLDDLSNQYFPGSPDSIDRVSWFFEMAPGLNDYGDWALECTECHQDALREFIASKVNA